MELSTMKFGVLTEKGKAEIHTRSLPPVGPEDVLLKQLACNICTTDYGQWLGLREHQGYPMAGGHEVSGIVLKTGELVEHISEGDLVAVSYNSCGRCEKCMRGEEGQCASADYKNPTADGYKGNFGFSDYAVRPGRTLVKINPDLNPSAAAFLEPLATVCMGLKKARLQPMETVVVIGAGTMGLLNALTARAYNCRVIVTELMEKKLETARKAGLETVDVGKVDPVETVMSLTGGKGADVVIVAVGNTKANSQAIDLLKKVDGRVLLFAAGYPAPEITADSNLIHYRRIELLGTFGADTIDFLRAAELLNAGTVDVSPLIEPCSYELSDIQDAFAAASKPGAFRVSVKLN